MYETLNLKNGMNYQSPQTDYSTGLAASTFTPFKSSIPSYTGLAPEGSLNLQAPTVAQSSYVNPNVLNGATPQGASATETTSGFFDNENKVKAALGAGTLGLGLLGFLEDRKTGKLQREAMRENIASTKEHRANRAALGASWNAGWGQTVKTPANQGA